MISKSPSSAFWTLRSILKSDRLPSPRAKVLPCASFGAMERVTAVLLPWWTTPLRAAPDSMKALAEGLAGVTVE